MTEEQLRDILARVVPEPPDSVADPAPVVRAARRQRRVAASVVGAVAVLAVVGTVLGVQAVRDDGPDFVEQPAEITDPYTTAPCPELTQPWPEGAIADLDAVTAVRHCARPGKKGFPTVLGPADGLVVGLDTFVAAVRKVPDADPARCAAVSVVPVDNRALLQLSDGTQVAVETGSCGNVEVEGRVIDGHSLLQAVYAALREQRDAHDYATSQPAPEVDWCGTYTGTSPATPEGEHLVAATFCGPHSPTKGGTVLDEATVARLDAAWRSAEPTDPEAAVECDEFGGTGLHILARTDRGDLVDLSDYGCDTLSFSPSTSDTGLGVSVGTLSLEFAIEDLVDD
jgi:hypothetical protein